jgi:hypothetical protein
MNERDGIDRDCSRTLLADTEDQAMNPDQTVASLALSSLRQRRVWPDADFISEPPSDRMIEEAGRRIYESQQARLSDQTSLAAKRAWRSQDVPTAFWESYREDARAALFR